MTIKRTIKQLVTTGALMLALAAPAKAQTWINGQAGYRTQDQLPTTRVESGSSYKGVSMYGFADIEGSKEHSFPKNSYGEFRASYPILKEHRQIQLGGEYNAGNNFPDTVRLGVLYLGSPVKNNFTKLDFYPFETSGKLEPQVGLFSAQTIGRITPSVLVDYNTKSKNMYSELEFAVKANEHVTLFARERGFGTMNHPNWQPLVGIKYTK